MNFHLDKLVQPIVSHFLNAQFKLEVEQFNNLIQTLHFVTLVQCQSDNIHIKSRIEAMLNIFLVGSFDHETP